MKLINVFTIIMTIILVGFMGCADDNYPDSIWDPNEKVNDSPVISSVVPLTMTEYTPPADSLSSYAGVGQIRFEGKNFSSTATENIVFFNSTQATILASTPTMIDVRAPVLIDDSLAIKIATQGAYLYSNEIYPFNLMSVENEMGAFIGADDVNAIAVDASENFYASSKKNIYIMQPDSIDTKSIYATFTASGAGAMVFGPSKYLYFVQNYAMFRVDSIGTYEPTWFMIFNTTDIIRGMDFDSNGNLFAIGKLGDIYKIDVGAKSKTVVASMEDVSISAVRVYDNNLYVSGSSVDSLNNEILENIWRFPINTDGSLGDQEAVFDWFAYSDGNITSITFDHEGFMYIGADGAEPISVLSTGNSIEILYPNVISGPINKMVWGTGDYLYVNSGKLDNKKTWRINVGKTGAPYYGRQ
ncbi:MAG: hypothetical protein HQ528_11250 [Candidatus Marinimicrobia bacterium]|nr:hypothetical protein [Candidatus Neomarinimicrobiota bacterium]